jgi:predicted metal-dependent hydrolase
VTRPAPLSARLAAVVAHEPALHAGVRLFDAGHYWHAHECWEQAWKADAAADRHFLKGLIQLAAACHHVQRGAHAPALRLAASAHAHLAAHQGPRWPFHHHTLLLICEQLHRALSAGDAVAMPHLAGVFHGLAGARAPM